MAGRTKTNDGCQRCKHFSTETSLFAQPGAIGSCSLRESIGFGFSIYGEPEQFPYCEAYKLKDVRRFITLRQDNIKPKYRRM